MTVKSKNVNDATFHNILLSRTEQSVQLLVDEMFVNRTISPGSAATLDIQSEHFYVGATIDVRDGSLSNGLQGCVVGMRLDRKEVPLGGGNAHFTTLEISNGVQNGCPIGTLFETPQSATDIYTGVGMIVAVLGITSVVFVVICYAIRRWRERRQRTHTYFPPSREGSRRMTSRSSGFTWQMQPRPPTSQSTLDDLQGHYRTSLQSNHQSFCMCDTSPSGTLEFDTKSRYPFPCPVTDVVTNVAVAETAVDAKPSFLDRIDSVPSSKRRQHRLSPIQEDFSAVSQSNPGFVEAPPRVDRHKFQDGPTTPSTTSLPYRNIRSPTSGHISIDSMGTDLSDITLNTSVGGDVEKYVQKRKEIANVTIEELNIDSVTHYREEGPYQSLGSIGSLYDFVRDIETDLNDTTSTDRSVFLPVTQIPLHTSQNTQENWLSPSLRPKSPSSGQPAMPEDFTLPFDVSDLKTDFSSQLPNLRSGPRASKCGSHHRVDHSRRINVMDRFQSLTAGNRLRDDSVETMLI